ncbi:MAG: hypothetical protein AMS17_15905 [Spirochaetes bacterium DG_61]|nr:MAG: hypothetical protein AMS17_15905 [Spirochaetes bacterium DG_61]
MMKGRFLGICLILMILVVPSMLSAQYIGQTFGFQMEDIRSVVLDDFEDNDLNWQVDGSRFKAEDFPQIKTQIEAAPIALQSKFAVGENKYVLGVRAAFTRKGYNRVWIYPEKELVIPGYAKKIDMWVWGANYYYSLEVHLRDYRGVVHAVPLGSLHFMGWKNLSAEIPRYIPQHVRYLPLEKPLTLVRLVVWTEPIERVDDYFIYFDQLKVLTDMYRTRFDGDVLSDQTYDIWSE